MAGFGQSNFVDYLARLAVATRELLPDRRFVVFGQGAELDLVHALARELGVLDRRFFVDTQSSKQDMAAAFTVADVATSVAITQPEMEASSADKLLDSLAAGRHIARNYGGWQAELLQAASRGRRS